MKATPRIARLLSGLLTTLLAAGLLRWILHDIDLQPLAQSLRALPVWAWALAGLGWLASYVIRAWRLRQEWENVRSTSLTACLRLVLLHNAAVQLMPLRTGEAGYLWLVHRQWGVSLRAAGASLFWLRLQDAAVLATLGLALLLPLPTPQRFALTLAFATFAATLLPMLAGQIASHFAPAARVGDALRRDRDELTGWMCCIANWTLRLIVVASLLTALSSAPDDAALRAAIGAELGAALPLQGPGSLGTYEAGAWAGSRLDGEAARHLAAAALVVHLFCLAVALAAALAVQLPSLLHRALLERGPSPS